MNEGLTKVLRDVFRDCLEFISCFYPILYLLSHDLRLNFVSVDVYHMKWRTFRPLTFL